jgi:DNA-binding CsgD family transcriptional regulator
VFDFDRAEDSPDVGPKRTGKGNPMVSGPAMAQPNPNPQIDVARFYETLSASETVAECALRFKKTVGQFGFDTFACSEVDLADRDLSVFFAIDWPERWRKFYISSGLVQRDPLLAHIGKRGKPFLWSDLGRDGEFAEIGREALRLLSDHGWTEGLVVPVKRGGTRYGLVSLVGNGRGIADGQPALLCLISEQFLSRVRSLVRPEDFPVKPAGLSAREVESLALVALGNSDAQIAEILGVAQSTAHSFVEGARKRLKATTRAQMIATAVSMGIVNNI